MNKLSKITLLSSLSLVLSTVPLMQAQAAITYEYLQVWPGNNQGQTIDQERSYAVVTCDSTGIVNVVGHVHKTNQFNQALSIAVKRNSGGATLVPNYTFPTNGVGNGDFAFTLTGFAAGNNNLIIEIQNYNFPGVNLYLNQTANNSSVVYGIPFVCPAP